MTDSLSYTGNDLSRYYGTFIGKKLQVAVDAAKDLLMNVLKYHPFLIKPNNHEPGEIYGVKINTRDEVIPYARKL